ncbi:hypothetical protein LTS15_001719 [Exophiala xenobiotica]|nr:hypothetical protein LTS15_001719 [Exophiala xenobiotica]
MTSLIFGTIYMGHKGIVQHRREKQRKKNYERWEGLRDEYDEQRKISRESRSLDIQRTGTGDGYSGYSPDHDDRPILTLRDQQEAGDARTGWRPQEAFDGPRAPATPDNRRLSVEVTSGSNLRPLTGHKTGATWDEGLPQPLRMTRRNWDDHQHAGSTDVSRSSSLRHAANSSANSLYDRSSSNTPSMNKPSPPPLPAMAAAPTSASSLHPHAARNFSTPASIPHYQSTDPIEHDIPGGPIAELISPHRPAPSPYVNHQQPQTYAGYQSNPFMNQAPTQPPAPAPAPAPIKVQPTSAEFWDRP